MLTEIYILKKKKRSVSGLQKKKTGTVMGTKYLHDLKLNISIFITKTAARYTYDPTLLVLRALLGL